MGTPHMPRAVRPVSRMKDDVTVLQSRPLSREPALRLGDPADGWEKAAHRAARDCLWGLGVDSVDRE